jgi:hypothetical protein
MIPKVQFNSFDISLKLHSPECFLYKEIKLDVITGLIQVNCFDAILRPVSIILKQYVIVSVVSVSDLAINHDPFLTKITIEGCEFNKNFSALM